MTAAEITASADTFLRAHRFRGAVLLAREGAVLLREGYGFANEEWTIPNSPLTKFRIGSITKMFTAAAVLRLAEAGAINLHSEIGKSVEDLPRAWRSITPHQLLNHTVGLADHVAVPAKQTFNLTGATPRELIMLIANQPLLFEPGTSYCYSNTGYFLLGMLIEKASNRSYAAYVEEEIFRPYTRNTRNV